MPFPPMRDGNGEVDGGLVARGRSVGPAGLGRVRDTDPGE